ncbi:MAG: hypothetical protein GOP50_10575 [Candidatus Heimdallarchaeota archaeon]|nr:hypothetical protein [Candidatus Heimdallarchaeota archaeon]
MKRGQTTIILTILVVSSFVVGFTPIEAATSYQALATGDQLLYKNVFTFYEDLEQQLLHEIDVADSWWVIDHWDYTYDEMESYSVNTIDTTTGNVNYAWTIYDRYNNQYQEDYYYDYLDQSWVLNNSYYDYEPFTLSSFEVKDFDVYNGTLNLDVTDWFSYGVYDHSEVKYYVINGANTSCNVDVYMDVYADENTTAYTYEGINFDETNPFGWEDVFYVDSDTGFLLEYTTLYYDNYYRLIDHKNSPTLGIFVDYFFNHTYGYYYECQLYETTAAYSPVPDADLPALLLDMGYDYDIRGDTDYLTIYFDLVNKWPSMTVDVLLDGTVIDTIYSMAPGSNYYNLYTAGIPISEDNHTVTFNVYDDASFEHNTTWTLDIQDIRLDWPVITGPVGEYWYTIGDYEILQWEFNDYYDNGNYYELRINGMLDNRSGLWTNGTLLYLDLSENITYAGDHIIQVFAADYNAYYTDLYLTIHASEPSVDATPPTITGSTSDFTMNEGEDIKLIWSIYDENPMSYEIKVNGATYDSGAWTENSKDILVLLKDFEDGVWTFEIIVFDAFSNSNSESVTVTINEVIVTTPEPTNPTEEPSESNSNSNTLTLDSSGLIYSILGILSFVSIVIIYRKRR